MNKRKKKQLIFIFVCFTVILAAYLGSKYYQNHLPVDDEEDEISVLDIDTSLVNEIGITNGEETINLQKDNDTWKCVDDKDFTIDSTKLQVFLDAAGSITSELKIENVTDMSQYGLDHPSLSISLQWDSNLYTIYIGDRNTVAGGVYYLKINDEDTVYTIENYKYNMLNKTKEDFAAEEETETAEEESDSADE
ncbi:MAG: DUF4340 domain-containing protein [Lachnospiraceae bacterium]|nr:DUF4340 domain-containing protein [Lachnospiraceae bacterium]MDD7628189.1 DUF4340 domain-containing protein [Lachnospiraceae bacterium]MDY4118178.1 DUF4340 domain-containing protein [Lachnospiraceae bacterium]